MQIDIREEIKDIANEIIAVRHDIHRHPEPGNNEYRTAQLIEGYLGSLGIETERITETAVIAVLKGAQPGRTAALRADMDALPVHEETGSDFASENPGIMHACGHDVHTAAALGAARLLSLHREELKGKIIFLFQPDEEGDGGALRMIQRGALTGADAVFGAHVAPDIPESCIGVRYGRFYAAADVFDVHVTGRASHAAEPEKGADALAAAAGMVTEIRKLPESFLPERCILTTGTFRSGTARNILADKASFSGIIRTLGEDSRNRMEKAFRETIERTAEAAGVKSEIIYKRGYPGITNDNGMTELVREAASDLLGEDRVTVIDEPTMKTEDFGYFSREVQGSFYHIGAGCSHPLHSSLFLPSDDAAVTAAAVHAAVILRFLNDEK